MLRAVLLLFLSAVSISVSVAGTKRPADDPELQVLLGKLAAAFSRFELPDLSRAQSVSEKLRKIDPYGGSEGWRDHWKTLKSLTEERGGVVFADNEGCSDLGAEGVPYCFSLQDKKTLRKKTVVFRYFLDSNEVFFFRAAPDEIYRGMADAFARAEAPDFRGILDDDQVKAVSDLAHGKSDRMAWLKEEVSRLSQGKVSLEEEAGCGAEEGTWSASGFCLVLRREGARPVRFRWESRARFGKEDL
jgi:hypothetical protein